MEKKIFTFYSVIDLPESIQPFIHESETVKFSVKTVRDVAVFTDKRILVADKQGITGKKVEYFSIPYKNIVTYSVETAGTFDLDSEIKLLLSGGFEVQLNFMKGKISNNLLYDVYHLINDYTITRS